MNPLTNYGLGNSRFWDTIQHILYFLKFFFNSRKVDIAVILKSVNWFASRFFTAIASLCPGETLHHHTWVEYLTWVRSQQNGEFHFIKTNRMRMNSSHLVEVSPLCRWDPTEVVFFFHVNSFYRALPPRQDCFLV